MADVKRLNINLPEQMYNDLQSLANQTGRSMTDVLRTGFGLAKVALEETRGANRLAVATPEGKVVKEIVIP